MLRKNDAGYSQKVLFSQEIGGKMSLKAFQKAAICLVVLAVALMLCLSGCYSSSSSSSGSGSSSSASQAKSRDFYKGTWLCAGYIKDGNKVSYSGMSAEQKRAEKHLVLQLDDAAYLDSVDSNGLTNDSVLRIFVSEWKPTNSGISVKTDESNVKFDLGENDLFSLDLDGAKYYFQKVIAGNELHVSDMKFKNVTFDAPIDIVYVQDAKDPSSEYYNVAKSCRHNGPTLLMATKETDASDVTELTDYYGGIDDYFVNYNGKNFFVYVEDETADVHFIDNGLLYKIQFDYYKKDSVDYSNYAKTFYQTIKIG